MNENIKIYSFFIFLDQDYKYMNYDKICQACSSTTVIFFDNLILHKSIINEDNVEI